MVLESLFPAKKILNKPLDMLLLSLIISFFCIFAAYQIFPAYTGIIAPLLITITMTPLVYRIFIYEEEIEREEAEHKISETFFERHGETILLFTLFFIGNFIAVFLITIFLPERFVFEAFSQQFDTIKSITSFTGYTLTTPSILQTIVFNNLKVMLFSFLLSFLFGTGALFILSWNASVLSLYLATFIRKGFYIEFINKAAGITPHAPVEILAYFLAGIAGGILSVGIIREKIKSKEFFLVLKDSILMLILAVFSVVFGAFIEVFI